jgi:hypothetical protein
MMEFVAKAGPFSPIRLCAAIGKMQKHWCPEPRIRFISSGVLRVRRTPESLILVWFGSEIRLPHSPRDRSEPNRHTSCVARWLG